MEAKLRILYNKIIEITRQKTTGGKPLTLKANDRLEKSEWETKQRNLRSLILQAHSLQSHTLKLSLKRVAPPEVLLRHMKAALGTAWGGDRHPDGLSGKQLSHVC